MTTQIVPQTHPLVQTFQGKINGETQPLVNARELHAFLESKQEFAHWISNRIEKYGFVEGSDYLIDKIIIQLPSGSKHKTDYHLSLNMAKELSMVERSDKGKMARQYFIAMEKLAHKHHAPMGKVDLDKVDWDTAWLIDRLQDEILRIQPDLLKLITYRKMGLSQREIALLLGISCSTVCQRLFKLAFLGFIDYTPNEKYQQMGRLGYQAKQAKQLTLGV